MDEASRRGDVPDNHPFLVDWNGDDTGTVQFEESTYRRVAGFLDGCGIAGREKDPSTQVECLLRASGHDDLFGMHSHTARS